jgi:predicted RNA-binding protein with PUA-like domain
MEAPALPLEIVPPQSDEAEKNIDIRDRGESVGRSRTWFLQANPRHYDIDAALDSLDQIWWRVPQYTAEIHVGDVALIWRSGKDAGIIGVGRVLSEPQLHPADPSETQFVLSGNGDSASDATRTLIQLRKTQLITKAQVQAIPKLHEHLIVRAPMGTVFAVTDDEWAALSELLPTPPASADIPGGSLPKAFGWVQRAKGVLPMPGGYDGYLDSLRKVCALVAEERPARPELAGRLEQLLEVKPTAARLRESFLRKVGMITVQGGTCRLSDWTEKWLRTGDDKVIVSLLHSRCQFIGELLDAALQPRSNDELLTIANERYGMGWDTQTQIANRRGWLQSARMLAVTETGKTETTPAGRALLADLVLFEPGAGPVVSHPTQIPIVATEVELVPTSALCAVDTIIDAIRESCVDSGNPDRFEQATRDAFGFLGFQAEWLGGAGKTDVLCDAVLGKDDTYRFIVDCKTSGSGSVGDQQVDWVTLAEHKTKHDADYVALVAPSPSGSRLRERAELQHVTIISVDQLAGLCRQHAKTPLGLDDYRSLFAAGGTVDTQVVDERAEETKRLTALAAAICAAIRNRSAEFGRLSARDLFLILASEPTAEATTEDELQTLLETLASPLLRLLDGSKSCGYRVTTSPEVFRMRLDVVAEQLLAMGTPELAPSNGVRRM